MTTTKLRPAAQAPPVVFSLPPDGFARAWANLRATLRMSPLGIVWLEWFAGTEDGKVAEGCWMVASGGPVTLAAWVAGDPADEEHLPPLHRDPDVTVALTDPSGALDDMCRRLFKAYGKDVVPGLGDYLQVRPGARVDGTQLALAGMAAPVVSIWETGDRLEVPGAEVPCVRWRHIANTFDQASRDAVSLTPELCKVVASLRGPYRVPQLRFGTGSNAMVKLIPETGGWPVILGIVDVGRRGEPDIPDTMRSPFDDVPSPEAGELKALTLTTYDETTETYHDAPGDDWEDPRVSRFETRLLVAFDIEPGTTEVVLRRSDGSEEPLGLIEADDEGVVTMMRGWHTDGGARLRL